MIKFNEIEISSQLTRYLPNSTLLLGFRASRIDHSFNLNDIFIYHSQTSLKITVQTCLLNKFLAIKIILDSNMVLKVHLALQNIIYVQPQFTISYDTEKTRIGYQTYSLNGGIYRQFIQQFDIANVPSAIRSFNRIDIPVINPFRSSFLSA